MFIEASTRVGDIVLDCTVMTGEAYSIILACEIDLLPPWHLENNLDFISCYVVSSMQVLPLEENYVPVNRLKNYFLSFTTDMRLRPSNKAPLHYL